VHDDLAAGRMPEHDDFLVSETVDVGEHERGQFRGRPGVRVIGGQAESGELDDGGAAGKPAQDAVGELVRQSQPRNGHDRGPTGGRAGVVHLPTMAPKQSHSRPARSVGGHAVAQVGERAAEQAGDVHL
jgi:hypothetical protein